VSLVASSGTSAKIDAKEWLQQVARHQSHTTTTRSSNSLLQVLAPLGGKGGGKPSKAQGSAADTAKLNDVLELATKFAQAKLQ
jgi:alanyl-tRNA synthetase